MKTRIVILAAGKGTRMGANVPKPLVEVSGRPIIHHLLEGIEESGIDDQPILVVSPDGIEQFGNLCQDSRCEYVIQEEQLGTGHAVECALDKISEAESVIVLYGDHPFISADILNQVNDLHTSSSAAVCMLTIKVPSFKDDYIHFEKWGRIIRDEVGGVQEIIEYKDASDAQRDIKELNPGIYSFDRVWLQDHIAELTNDNASKEYYLTQLIEMAIEEGSDVITSQAENPFEVMGINTPEELERAERIMG